MSAVSLTVSTKQIEISLFSYLKIDNFPPQFLAKVYSAEKKKLIDRLELRWRSFWQLLEQIKRYYCYLFTWRGTSKGPSWSKEVVSVLQVTHTISENRGWIDYFIRLEALGWIDYFTRVEALGLDTSHVCASVSHYFLKPL